MDSSIEIAAQELSRQLQIIASADADQRITLDDRGLSAVFAETVKPKYRYCTTSRGWMYFDGSRWRDDVGGVRIAEQAKGFAGMFGLYASRIPDETKRAAYMKAAAKYGSLRFRQTLITDAQSVYPVSRSEFDRDNSLLNLVNGTLDLDSGELLPHDPDDLLTKRANVIFDPAVSSETWERFVSQIMEGDTEKIAYLQRICGLCLTADTSLECLWLLYGASTRNGKSTFVETMARLLGDYALSTPPETLSQRKRQAGAASGDLARLDGCRFLNASEPPKRMLLDTALVKTLTGRDSITARNLYEREFQFVPKFKLLINTNNLPVVSDDTLFTSERVRVIEFPHHFSEAEQDPHLKQRLCQPENLSGLLNWCLAGLREYRKTGEKPPTSVKSATTAYQKDSDKISMFFSEVLEEDASSNIAGSTAYDAYSQWCEDSGFGVDSKSSFFADLRSRALLAETATVNGKTVHNAVRGYRIKPIWT